MSPLASIDVGSNTIRLLIGRLQDNRIVRLRTEMVITRLAAGISQAGLLSAGNIEKSISVLKAFSRLISEYEVSQIKAVGTSALREAENSKEFIYRVLSETGIRIEVISGNEEARLTAKGVLFDIQNSGSSFIIDIGGGSTEWILCKDSFPASIGTIPTGVVKLFDDHIKSDPPSKDDIFLLGREIEPILSALRKKIFKDITSNTVLIGTAGTITTLASIDLGLEVYDHEKIHEHTIALHRLYEIAERLIKTPLQERKQIKGLEHGRADLIIPGILFTIKIMEMLGFEYIYVSDNGLLEGAFIKLSEEASQLN